MALPGYLKQFTIAYYLQALVPHAMPSDGVASLLQGMFRENPAGAGLPGLAVRVFGRVFCIWRPGWSSGRNTSWSSRAVRPQQMLRARTELRPPCGPYTRPGRPACRTEDPLFRGGFGRDSGRRAGNRPCGLLHGPAGFGVLERRRSRRTAVCPGRRRRRGLRQRARRHELRVPPAVPRDRTVAASDKNEFEEKTGLNLEAGHRLGGRGHDAEGRPGRTSPQARSSSWPAAASRPSRLEALALEHGAQVERLPGQAPHHPSRQRRRTTRRRRHGRSASSKPTSSPSAASTTVQAAIDARATNRNIVSNNDMMSW